MKTDVFPTHRFLFSLIFLVAIGCQSPRLVERYYDVEIGSTKGDVLERMGSPRQVTRVDSLDHWYYDLRPHRMRRVFIFDNNVLKYKGPILPPAITAEEEDQIHEPPAKLSPRTRKYKRPHTDEELREILRKEVEKSKPQKKPKFEKI